MSSLFDYAISYLAAPAVVFSIFHLFRNKRLDEILIKVADRINSRGLFTQAGTPSDNVVLNLVRVFLSLLLLYRLYHIHQFTAAIGYTPELAFQVMCYLVLISLLLVGLFAPIAALLLLLFQLWFNYSLKTYTLGVDVTAMLLLCFVLYPVGQWGSVDSYLYSRWRSIGGLYRWFSFCQPREQATLAKAISFFSYGLLCLYSVLLHLEEPLWMNGDAAIHLLSSTYLSQYPDFFTALFSTSSIAVWVAKLSMLGMVAWYFLLLPAAWIGGVFRYGVIAWAILFFLLSLFVLQLSILPYLEFSILFLWFWDCFKRHEGKRVCMLYDDRCNLCDRTVRTLKVVDIQGILEFLPVSKNKHEAERVGVATDRLLDDIYSWDQRSGTIYAGYDFYLHISRRLLLLFPLFPFLWLMKLIRIGPFVYRLIASYRIRMFGVCKLPVDPSIGVSSGLLGGAGEKKQRYFFTSFFCTSVLFSLVFILIMPVSPVSSFVADQGRVLVKSAHALSWSKINVFNRADLTMTHHFYTVKAIREDGVQILPFVDSSGRRLDWHVSDRVYFGNSLAWRRYKTRKPLLPITRKDRRSFCEVVIWAESLIGNKADRYRVEIYQSEWPKPSDGVFKFDSPKKVTQLDLLPTECRV